MRLFYVKLNRPNPGLKALKLPVLEILTDINIKINLIIDMK